MEPLGPFRVDEIFADLSRESDKNRATLSKKGREMAFSSVTNKTGNPTVASNPLNNWYQSECFNTS